MSIYPCTLFSGIEVIFIGIGDSWRQARIDCLVGDTTNDVISIASYSESDLNASLPTIYQRICPIDTKIKISEVKPINTGSAPRFVEFFNMGMSITSSDTLNFDGLITGSITNNNIDQGVYFVLFDEDDGGSLSCSQCGSQQQCTVNTSTNLCDEAVYIPCGNSYNCQFNSQSMTIWNIDIMDDSSNMLDSLTYSTDESWPIAPSDYSYSLEYLGYNNEYGANYVRSCTVNASPGSPTLNCTSNQLQCSLAGQCQQSGDNGADCNQQTGECLCSNTGFYPKRGSCYPIPQPSNCIAYKVKNGSQNFFRFQFDGAPFDANEFYSVVYYQTATQMVTITDQSRIRTENDVYYVAPMAISGYVYTELDIDGYSSPFKSYEWSSNCSIITQSPTDSPTPSPTLSPTSSPTLSPTASPTWTSPKIYLSGDFCQQDRCFCNGKGWDCCLAENATNANCTDKQRSWTAGFDTFVFNSIKLYPETYPYPTLIQWRIRYNGTTYVDQGYDESQQQNTTRNSLGITVNPMNGSAWINGTTSINIPLTLNESEIICPENNTDCTKDLIGLSAVFVFEAYECTTWNDQGSTISDICNIVYPSQLNMYIDRSDTGGGGIGGGGEDKIPTWLWIVLIAGAIFLLLLSWLLYRYWYKGRKQSLAYHKITDDIIVQTELNDQSLTTKLQNKDTQFNPLATGMPGKDREHDPLTAERQERAKQQENDMVEPNAVKNVFREEMGQKAGNRNSNSQNMNAPLLG